MSIEQTTPYFRNEVLRKRPYLTIVMCRKVIENPYRKERKDKILGKIEELGGRYLRVVTLIPLTIHPLKKGQKESRIKSGRWRKI